MSVLTLKINYRPHPGQSEFHENQARFRILACGRRWGKTKSGANEAVKQTIASGKDNVGFCVAPTYWHTQKQWTEFMLYCPRELIVNVNRGEHSIELLGNRKIWFKSADNPDSLRSEGLDWLWMDEGGQIKEEAWNLALRPALMDKKGCAWFTGTPKGHNWYWLLWLRGQNPDEQDYQSWQYSSKDNPYIDPQEIEEFARDMPKMAYRQEILAEFLEDIGTVFRGVDNIVDGVLEPVKPGKSYVIGVDLAKHEDYTVMCVLDENGHLCHFDRWGEYDWVYQRKRLVNLATQFNNARLLIDSTGVGDPVFDELRRESVSVDGYKFTNASKKDLIENLAMQIENRAITVPAYLGDLHMHGNESVLERELRMFGYETLPSGLVRYSAPEGMHDDCVIALALAVWQISRPKGYVII